MEERTVLCTSKVATRGDIHPWVIKNCGVRFGQSIQVTLYETTHLQEGQLFPSHSLVLELNRNELDQKNSCELKINWLYTLHPKPHPESTHSEEQKNLTQLTTSPYSAWLDGQSKSEHILKLVGDDGYLDLNISSLSDDYQNTWLKLLGFAVASAICEDGFKTAPCGRLKYLYHTSLNSSMLLDSNHPMLLRANHLLRMRIKMDMLIDLIQRGDSSLLYKNDFVNLLDAIKDPLLLNDGDVVRLKRVNEVLGNGQERMQHVLKQVREELSALANTPVTPTKSPQRINATAAAKAKASEVTPEIASRHDGGSPLPHNVPSEEVLGDDENDEKKSLFKLEAGSTSGDQRIIIGMFIAFFMLAFSISRRK